jgi:hypothetical protein
VSDLLREAVMLLYDWEVLSFGNHGSVAKETRAFLEKVGYDPMTATLRTADQPEAAQREADMIYFRQAHGDDSIGRTPDQQSAARKPEEKCPHGLAIWPGYSNVCCLNEEGTADPKSAPYTPPCCKDAPEWMAVVTCNPGCPRATDKPSGEHQHNDPRAEDQ